MFKGRIDGSAVLIDNPISLLTHIKQLQNWSELELSLDWGKELCSTALIKTSGAGSFNDSFLDDVKAQKIARQLLTFDECYTDTLTQSICEQFQLMSYQDKDGYECVKDLLALEAPTLVIDFADTKGKITINEPSPANIHCTPVINYAYDYAFAKYTQQISVNNVWEATHAAAYTPGLDATDGPVVWATCRALWNRTRQIEPMPANLSNLSWVSDYDTAVWCLKRQLAMMSFIRASFSLPYSAYRDLDVGTHFMLQLPHETDDLQIECSIERISKNKNNKTVTVQVAFLDEIITNIYDNGIYEYISNFIYESEGSSVLTF